MVLHTAVDHFWKSTAGENTRSKGQQNEVKVRPHIITSNIEHDSIKLPLEHFQKAGIAGEFRFTLEV